MENVIRQKLIKFFLEYCPNKNIKEITSTIDTTLKENLYCAVTVTKQVEIDLYKMFDLEVSIKKAQDYLNDLEKTYGYGNIVHKWNTYQEDYFVYEYNALETEEEIFTRLKLLLVPIFYNQNNTLN